MLFVLQALRKLCCTTPHQTALVSTESFILDIINFIIQEEDRYSKIKDLKRLIMKTNFKIKLKRKKLSLSAVMIRIMIFKPS